MDAEPDLPIDLVLRPLAMVSNIFMCFVLYEPPVINGAHTPRMVVTE
jgi:hypothetical protein